MVKVSGFADEISKDVAEQIDGLKRLNIRYTALRGAWGKNIMDWTDEECARIRGMLDAAGIGVSEIGSPVGKDPIDEPFEKTQQRLARMVALAKLFRTPNIRMFSFYPPADDAEKPGWEKKYRGEVLRRMQGMADQVANEPVMLMLENEAELYGDYPAECLDIFRSVRSPKLAMAFDFANFVSRKSIDVYAAWRQLAPFVKHIHVKDYIPGQKTACVAGEGQGRVKDILAEVARSDYDGFLTLEPHLGKAERFQGYSGIEKFKLAADGLAKICAAVGLRTE